MTRENLIRVGLVVACLMTAAVPVFTHAHEQTEPKHLNPLLKSNEAMSELPPWPAEMLKRGGGKNYERVVFRGDTVAAIYDASDMIVYLRDQPYDEFVYVIQGNVEITPAGGNPKIFKGGDFFYSPKGFTGSWKTSNRYRELYIIDKAGFEAGSNYSEGKEQKK